MAKVKHNPASRVGGKGVTLRNMASITIKRLPGGAVAITGRKLAGTGRANPGRRNYALIVDRGTGKRDAILYFATRKQAEVEARRFKALGGSVRIEKTVDASLQ